MSSQEVGLVFCLGVVVGVVLFYLVEKMFEIPLCPKCKSEDLFLNSYGRLQCLHCDPIINKAK